MINQIGTRWLIAKIFVGLGMQPVLENLFDPENETQTKARPCLATLR